LKNFKLKVPGNDKHISDCLWGKLASDILTQNWEQSAINLTLLREWIDKNEVKFLSYFLSSKKYKTEFFLNFFLHFKKDTNSLLTLQQRCWLIHWGLYVYFHHPKGREQLIDLFFTHGQERFLNK
jgi:translation initiation factor 3 subunit E